eukprot:Blabericola_migrator_1__3966@NODE_21_length_22536_cov_99_458098_g18_i0_p27_GENE_NODE_21_length_22536_cov_99_458098_g18_i0NODE_21_length_22536_cov_99_458098_g18_i0_p27_ORF_typecomplete_len108_score5_68DUF2434/PF10361_9/0_089_NODE_21_length_22536_cov_99_458098_g18_i021062429
MGVAFRCIYHSEVRVTQSLPVFAKHNSLVTPVDKRLHACEVDAKCIWILWILGDLFINCLTQSSMALSSLKPMQLWGPIAHRFHATEMKVEVSSPVRIAEIGVTGRV